MVFFLHMIIFDSDAGVAVTPGGTYLVTESGNELLSRSEFRLQVA